MLDSNLFLRTSGAGSLTATETSSAKQITFGTPIKGLSVIVAIPKRDVGDTMQVTIQESLDNSVWDTCIVLSTIASVTQTNTTSVVQKARFASRGKYFRSVTTVAGTSPDFGAVQIAIGAHEWANQYTVANATTLDQT